MSYKKVDRAQVRREPVCVVGAGPAGLIAAHVLIQDGFENVQVFTKDPTVGGVWARERVYPTMKINNVHGQFHFSWLPMPEPIDGKETGNRLGGDDISRYMEAYYEKYLSGTNANGSPIIRFNSEVLSVRRGPNATGWEVQIKNASAGTSETLYFPRIVICTGGLNTPNFAKGLSPDDARSAGFRGVVAHSSDSWAHMDEIIAAARGIPVAQAHALKEASIRNSLLGSKEKCDEELLAGLSSASSSEGPAVKAPVVIIGGGKSAQDISHYLASQDIPVSFIFRRLDHFIAFEKPSLPTIEQSRIMSVVFGHSSLNTYLEKFIHNSRLGRWLHGLLIHQISTQSIVTYSIPDGHPLRLTVPFFWTYQASSDGMKKDDSFVAYVLNGKIKTIAPARASHFEACEEGDGGYVVLENGEKIRASSVICSTGFKSSWAEIFDKETQVEVGLVHQVDPRELDQFEGNWDYLTLQDPPTTPQAESAPFEATGLYRGIVPAKTIERRDIALNGAIASSNNGYTFEVCAHWISAYFLGEEMRLPASPEAARQETLRHLAWTKKRYPEYKPLQAPSLYGRMTYLCWPQDSDELLEDMYLKSMRNGGNWWMWVIQPIQSGQLADVGAERRLKRGEI